MSYSSTAEKLTLIFSLKNCEKNMYYKISASLEDTQSGYKEKFKTEEIQCLKDNSEIIFNKKMSCKYYFERKQEFKIEIVKMPSVNSSNSKSKIIERVTVLSSLVACPNSIYERKLIENIKELICIKLEREITNSIMNNNKSLFEYFKSGIKLSCFISLDFSNSKKNPSLIDTKINYEHLLKYISIIFSNYTKNHLFYAYGFGAKQVKSSINNSIFNLNMNEKDSAINTIETVIKYFRKNLKNNLIIPENNIKISSLIKKTTKKIYEMYEMRYYNIAFIIIRGEIERNDINATIDEIIKSSYLPLTLFIIGVGKNDYSQMKKIFGRDNKFSTEGMEKNRDNTFFLSLIEDFSNSEEQLVSWCAMELYKQIITYYDLIKSSPKSIYQQNLEKIKESFNLYNYSICAEKPNSSIFKNENESNFKEMPNKNDIFYSNLSQDSINENISQGLSNEKINNNKNNKNGNSNNQKALDGTNKLYFITNQNTSINPIGINNYYCQNNNVEGDKIGMPSNDNNCNKNKQYFIPNQSITESYQMDNNYNPYLTESEKKNLGNNKNNRK